MARRTKAAKAQKEKQKKDYSIIAPPMFNNKNVGEILGSSKENLLNRVVSISLNELEEVKADPLSLYTTVKLRVIDVGEGTVKTDFIGHEIAFSYLRSLMRKYRSVIHEVIDVNTKDGGKIRLKLVIITAKKVSRIVKKNLRKAAIQFCLNTAKEKTRDEIIKSILSNQFSKEMGKELNKINPISHVLVRKTEQNIIAS